MTPSLSLATHWLQGSTWRNVPPRRGEVWLFDCGNGCESAAGFSFLAFPLPMPTARTVLPLCSTRRGFAVSEFEIKIQVPFLKEKARLWRKASPLIQPFARFANSARLTQRSLHKLKPPSSSGLVDQGVQQVTRPSPGRLHIFVRT